MYVDKDAGHEPDDIKRIRESVGLGCGEGDDLDCLKEMYGGDDDDEDEDEE